jgi:hypothetical protein
MGLRGGMDGDFEPFAPWPVAQACKSIRGAISFQPVDDLRIDPRNMGER